MQPQSMIRLLRWLLVAIVVVAAHPAPAQQPDAPTVQQLDSRLRAVESKFPVNTGIGALAFLYGVVCALWAKNSGRSAWLWFFAGFFFSVIAALVMLYKNGLDRDEQPAPGPH